MSTKFVTAPDKLPTESNVPVVLIIDAPWSDIENIGLLSMHRTVNYHIYIFGPKSIDYNWLSTAIDLADVILINEGSENLSTIKEDLFNNKKSVGFGGEKSLYPAPIDYFIARIGAENK